MTSIRPVEVEDLPWEGLCPATRKRPLAGVLVFPSYPDQ
jgi:hypothetical protein